MATSRVGTAKVLHKLKKSVEDGNYYEAHQMYHSVFQRYLKQSKVDDAIELVYSGAVNLLTHGQIGSGADLAVKLVEIFTSADVSVLDDSAMSKIIEIINIFPVTDSMFKVFVRNTLKWSAKHSESPTGYAYLHHLFGNRYAKEHLYFDAEHHFMYGTSEESPRALANLAYETAKTLSASPETSSKFSDPLGYLVARNVCGYLVLKRFACANLYYKTIVDCIKRENPKAIRTEVPYFDADAQCSIPFMSDSKLVNFAALMLQMAGKTDSQTTFTDVKNFYEFDIKNCCLDENENGYLEKLVTKIGEIYYGMGRRQQPNIMEELMKSFFQ